MEVVNLSSMLRGWFIGNFEPSVLKTNFLEVGVVTHKKGEEWREHYHTSSIEYNLLLDGIMTVNGTPINKNDIFIIDKNESSSPMFLTDCRILVIRIPDIRNDKVIV